MYGAAAVVTCADPWARIIPLAEWCHCCRLATVATAQPCHSRSTISLVQALKGDCAMPRALQYARLLIQRVLRFYVFASKRLPPIAVHPTLFSSIAADLKLRTLLHKLRLVDLLAQSCIQNFSTATVRADTSIAPHRICSRRPALSSACDIRRTPARKVL